MIGEMLSSHRSIITMSLLSTILTICALVKRIPCLQTWLSASHIMPNCCIAWCDLKSEHWEIYIDARPATRVESSSDKFGQYALDYFLNSIFWCSGSQIRDSLLPKADPWRESECGAHIWNIWNWNNTQAVLHLRIHPRERRQDLHSCWLQRHRRDCCSSARLTWDPYVDVFDMWSRTHQLHALLCPIEYSVFDNQGLHVNTSNAMFLPTRKEDVRWMIVTWLVCWHLSDLHYPLIENCKTSLRNLPEILHPTPPPRRLVLLHLPYSRPALPTLSPPSRSRVLVK